MRITSLYCQCRGGEVALDHYQNGACTGAPAPLPWLLGILHNLTSDTRHAGNAMTATRLATCPRRIAIDDNFPVPSLDLIRYNSIAFGWSAHAFMEKFAPPGFLTEVPLAGVLFKGTEFEVAVSGSADVIRPGILLLEDYKVTSEWSQQFRTKNPHEPHPEWDVQASAYNLLAPPEWKATRAAFWSGSIVSKRSKSKPWIEIPVRLDMTEREILEYKPDGGIYSVADYLKQRQAFVAALAAGKTAAEAIGVLPLAGTTGEEWVCDYCTVNHICPRLARPDAATGQGGLD